MPGFGVQTGGGTLQPNTLAALNAVGSGVYPTQGNIFFVNPGTGNDNNNGSVSQPLASLGAAYAMATAGQNDIIYLAAHSNTASLTTNYLGSKLTWAKDLVHLIGVNGGPMIGQRSRIANLAGTAAMAPMIDVTGNGCLFANLEIFQGTPGSGTTSIALQVTGQRNVFQNCQISGMGDLTGVADVSGSRSLKITGSENFFNHCYIGLDTVIRATMVEEVEIASGARNIFENCVLASYTSLSTFKAVAIATAVDRFVRFVDCTFYTAESITSAVAPTGAIGMTTMNGQVQVIRPSVFGYSLLSTGGNTSIKVLAFQNATTVQGIGASAAAS